MNKELIDFQRKCDIEGYPTINNAYLVCLVNGDYYYSDEKVYTLEESLEAYKDQKVNDMDRSYMEIDQEDDWCCYEGSPRDHLALEDIEEGYAV